MNRKGRSCVVVYFLSQNSSLACSLISRQQGRFQDNTTMLKFAAEQVIIVSAIETCQEAIENG
jgi:hypothetical protein